MRQEESGAIINRRREAQSTNVPWTPWLARGAPPVSTSAPVDAICLEEQVAGRWFRSDTRFGPSSTPTSLLGRRTPPGASGRNRCLLRRAGGGVGGAYSL